MRLLQLGYCSKGTVIRIREQGLKLYLYFCHRPVDELIERAIIIVDRGWYSS